MTYSKLRILCSFFLTLPILAVAQDSNFHDFKTTKSVGEPPAIFTTSFNDKVAAKVESNSTLSKDDIESYARYSNYSINHLLQSGFVLYGDPMTLFVQKVADKLLENEPKLKEELQFYVIKTNITNALCTDPGAIFITTGLISQIENEAQLAFVIAHEIVHYQEKHLEESFNKTKQTDLDANSDYEDLVLLSKDHEFEADKNALKLYHAAGYSDREINTVFDVLMYSYLTFDEIEIDQSFFGNSDAYIPQSYFPEKANPILASEDYDDSKSSHPNIRKRKDAISEEIKKFSDWKSNTHYISLEEFKNIQNIARFESVRGNIIIADYVKALYEIYILEKEFPNNEYLQTAKALTWNSMSQAVISGKKRSFITKVDEKEGAISVLYGFLKELDNTEMALLAIRQIEDVYQQYPESERLKRIRKQSIKNLAHIRRFELNKLEKISYLDAMALRDSSINDTLVSDTLNFEGETKYDRIRRIRAQQSSTESNTELIDENFSAFLLFDLASTREFYDVYEEEEKVIKEKENKVSLSRKERRKEEKNKEKLDGDIILISPSLEALKKGKFDLEKTLVFYDLMTTELEKYAPANKLHSLDFSIVENFTTNIYNEASMINSFLIQISNLENGDMRGFLFDNDEFDTFFGNYNNPYLLLISGQASRYSLTRKHVEGKARYIEIDTGDVINSNYYSVGLRLSRIAVGGFAHEIFSKFK